MTQNLPVVGKNGAEQPSNKQFYISSASGLESKGHSSGLSQDLSTAQRDEHTKLRLAGSEHVLTTGDPYLRASDVG